MRVVACRSSRGRFCVTEEDVGNLARHAGKPRERSHFRGIVVRAAVDTKSAVEEGEGGGGGEEGKQR